MELVLRQSSKHLTATFEVDCFAGVLVAVGEYSRDRVANAHEFIKEQVAQSKKAVEVEIRDLKKIQYI